MPDTYAWAGVAGPVILSALSVAGLVFSDFRQVLHGRFLFKPLAASAFIWLALSLSDCDTAYAQLLLPGLLLCATGDLLLMFESDRAFLSGLIAFLCGHLMYVAAFNSLPTSAAGLVLSVVPVLILVAGSGIWLRPHLSGIMRVAVPGYILVIALMLVFAGSTSGQPGARLMVAGAWGFALSDLAVARRQFVHASPLNGLWGTPLYFGSQMLLAGSLAFH